MIVTTICVLFLLGSAAASSCSNDTPFSPEIIGRRLIVDLTCAQTRYPDQSIVEVNSTHIIYFPIHTSYNFGQFCAESYVFKVNRSAPMMTHYPYLGNLSQNGHEICGAEQERKKVVAWPHGSARDQYADGLKKSIAGLTVLRDTHCRERGFGTNETELYHPWVEAPISYLRSVAYNYGFCLDD